MGMWEGEGGRGQGRGTGERGGKLSNVSLLTPISYALFVQLKRNSFIRKNHLPEKRRKRERERERERERNKLHIPLGDKEGKIHANSAYRRP